MESIIDFITSDMGSILPAAIAIVLMVFTTFGKRILEQRIESKYSLQEVEVKDRDQIESWIQI